MKENSVFVVPEPKSLDFTGKWLVFNGFRNFPAFLEEEFSVPKGDWEIVETDRAGTGLQVKDKRIDIWGDKSIGYATILQLIRQAKGYLPEVKVVESLKFRFRGYHLDIARGGVPNVETLKRILRWLFLLKYNYFAIYFEDLFPWRRHPQIGEHRGRLREDELNQVIEYGKSLGIEVFPSLEFCGHMEHILSLPEFRTFSEWHNPREGCLDLSNEKAKEFVYELLRETVEFFPSKYVHIGGDETWAMGRGKSLNKTWRFDGPELYESHHQRMVEIVEKEGKRPILWGDMISGMYLKGDEARWREVLESDVWKKVLVANWDYSASPKEHFKDKIRIFKDRGIDQIACPGLSNWNRYYPNFRTATENLKNFLTTAREEDLSGFLVTAWGDDGWECLFSHLDALLLAAVEIAEADGEWEEKWMAISGENKGVLNARLLFGNPDVSDVLKHVIYRDFWYCRLTEKRKEEIRSFWQKILEEVEDACLPEDLDFVRLMLEVGVKVLKNEVKASDYIMLSNLYHKLWLRERKTEGLGTVVERFWGAAGKQDMKLQRTL